MLTRRGLLGVVGGAVLGVFGWRRRSPVVACRIPATYRWWRNTQDRPAVVPAPAEEPLTFRGAPVMWDEEDGALAGERVFLVRADVFRSRPLFERLGRGRS